MAKRTTEKDFEAAVKLIAQTDIINGILGILNAAGISDYLVAGRTPGGNGFCANSKTMPRFIRGMVRQALKRQVEEGKPK